MSIWDRVLFSFSRKTASRLKQFEDFIDVFHWNIPSIGIEVIYICHLIDHTLFSLEVIDPLTNGQAAVFHADQVYLVYVYGPESRAVVQSETETVITGPHDSFTESASTNLSLVRRRVKSSHLKVLKLEVGEVTKTLVFVLYIKDIVNMELVTNLSVALRESKSMRFTMVTCSHGISMIIRTRYFHNS